mmetsp:Transcript_42/g.6  ORF Transcript_42/g.6 Transcript_42/m.6 type:complete len:92 (-) Transcript_42:155-430(-)
MVPFKEFKSVNYTNLSFVVNLLSSFIFNYYSINGIAKSAFMVFSSQVPLTFQADALFYLNYSYFLIYSGSIFLGYLGLYDASYLVGSTQYL